MSRRGALLLEVLLALAIMVAAGLAILSLVADSGNRLRHVRDEVFAADMAKSAMGRIEAGLDTPETLSGPVRAWQEPGSQEFEDSLPPETEWELQIETEPSPFAGLTRVTVTARRMSRSSGANDPGEGVGAVFSQLVRLSVARGGGS